MKYCLICRQEIEDFLPFENGFDSLHPVQKALQWVGSDIDHFYCPKCGSFDRERHLFVYLSAAPQLLQSLHGGRILHFAAERYLSLLIANAQPLQYVKANIVSNDPEVEIINIERISYPDDYFDIVIANHILEHVNDDRQAVNEVRRVLKTGGHAILQTPYCSTLPSSICEFTPSSLETRTILFGQFDHVRAYGSDVFSRIAESGLRFIGGKHDRFNISVDSRHLGINPVEPFFLFQK